MSVTGNPYGFYPDRTKYPLSDLDGQLVPKAHTHPTGQIVGLADEYAAKNHTHPTSQITGLANEYAAKNHTHTPQHLVYLDDAAVQEGNLVVTEKNGVYYFEIQNNEPTGDPDLDAIISQRVRTELERMHMPESDMMTITGDDYTGSAGAGPHSVIYYWLKGGLIIWSYAGDPDWTADTTEVKNLGVFRYPDGSPCPYYHAHGHLHFHQIDPTRGLAFLCHPQSWPGAEPWTAAVAMHKKAWSNPPMGADITGIGAFVMTGEHFRNDGTEANPVWVQDRPPWQSGVYSS